MNDYKKIIKEHYDKQKYGGREIKSNIYAPINPIGFYGEFKIAQILAEFISMICLHNRRLDKINVCDCGCGDGVKTRFLAELLGNPNQVYGIEYSKNRLQHCKNMNSFIHYEYADLTKKIPFDIQFDGITVFDVFMHFKTEEEITDALKNIYDSLKRKGIFVWDEPNVKSHWTGGKKGVNGWGFSAGEMDKYALNAGFKLKRQFGIYTKVPIIDKPTLYLVKKIKNIWILEIFEKLPFKKNNNIRIYYKE